MKFSSCLPESECFPAPGMYPIDLDHAELDRSEKYSTTVRIPLVHQVPYVTLLCHVRLPTVQSTGVRVWLPTPV